VVVAHLVAPEHFGALAVALAVQAIAMNASELGATASLARGHRDPDEIAPTVYTIALVTSTSLTLAMFGSAGWVAGMMGDPAATPVIRAMSLTVLLAGFSSVPSAMIWRDFQQHKRMFADLAAIVSSTALVIPMALAGWEAMALAWSRVGGQVVATVILLAVVSRRYRPGFDRREARELVRTGMPLALANVVVFATLNIDYLVVGRQLGSTRLGLYLLAFNLASLPSNVFTQVLRTVAVPAFGRLHARGRLREAVPRTMALVALVSFPSGALLAGLASPLIVAVYGNTWAAAASALVGLGVFAAGRTVTELLADVSMAIGRTGALFWVQVLWLVALLPVMWISVAHWGIAGAGIAHAVVVWMVVVPAYVVVIRRATGVPVRVQVLAAGRATVASLACGGLGWLLAGAIVDPWLALVAGGLAGAAVYVILMGRKGFAALRGMTALDPDQDPAEPASDRDPAEPAPDQPLTAAPVSAGRPENRDGRGVT
jgi:O-antigen/teichoic acid export membrane protein